MAAKMSMKLVQRTLGVTLFLLVGWVTSAGCGRSNLDDYSSTNGDAGQDAGRDSSVDGGSCNPANCPSGCCNEKGKCVGGTDFQACGGKGQTCQDCKADNFDHCDPSLHACATDTQECNALTCPTGCCSTINGKPTCISGVSSGACGSGGQACADCTQSGQLCDATTHQCQNSQCGPNNCKGCCAGGVCLGGSDNGACGIAGGACAACASNSSCNPQNGKCEGPPPQKCTPQNCPNGCCTFDTCVAGVSDTQCGTSAANCQDCTNQSQVCAGGKCIPPMQQCNAQNCVGCCQNNVCFAGFLDSRCGSNGASCSDCSSTMSTCNTQSTPRVCTNQQTSCPAAYGSCPNNASTPPLSVQTGVCSANDLLDAKNACKTGFNSASCQNFFTTISSINASCFKCLSPFEFDLQAGTGIYNCVAAFVSANCDHSIGCAIDCVDTSCNQCPSMTKSSCQTQVRGNGGQCTSYFQQTACVLPSLFNGPGSFCGPQKYFGNYGNWLAGVGQHYCGP